MGDITEIECVRALEKDLHDCEENYHTLFNLMNGNFCIIEIIFDFNGKPMDWRYLETSPTHKQTVFNNKNIEGKLISELVSEVEEYWLETFGKVALTGEPVRVVNELKALKRWYDINAFKIGRPDSKKVAILCNDITERIRNEEKLTFQVNLLNSVQDAIIAVDENNKFNYWNDISEKILGWSAQEVLGHNVEEFFPSNSSNSLFKPFEKLRTEGCYIGELEYHRKDGKLITLDAHIKRLVNQDGEYEGGVASIRDITKLKQKEAELITIKNSLAAEVEGLTKLHAISRQFISQNNLQEIYKEILEAAITLTHTDKGCIQIFDKQINCLKIIESNGLEEQILNQFKFTPFGKRTSGKAFSERRRVIVEDIQQTSIYSETDKKCYLYAGIRTIQSTPLISNTGSIVGILLTYYTLKHQFEERELRMLDLLARTAADVIERTINEEAIQRSEKRALFLVKELRKMDKNKNEFLSVLSHELRNPLASIMMSLSLLDIVEPDGEQVKQIKEVMKRQTNQLSRLVNDLTDITRITQNKINLKKERVNLNELISRVVEDSKLLFESKGVSLKVDLTSIPLYMEADPVRLAQVIGNLLDNSAKFTAKGDNTLVTVWKDEDKQEAVICVQDNGMGIKPDLIPDLFHPFIQLDDSLARSSGGFGLGLAIVKGMVELHGGSVSAFSEGSGKGSQFTIRLPLFEVSNNNRVEQPKVGKEPSQTLRILVIDDIPDVAEILCSLLRQMGHEVISANNGCEGITKAKEFRPDVLLCDIGMPGMNGYEVAKIIRCDNELMDVFLIALTGYAQPDDLMRAKECGFDRHVAKPVDFDTLKQILAEI